MARRRGGLLRHPNFRLLWLGETISGAGTAMAATGVPLLAVTVLHAGAFAVAALSAAAYLRWLVIGLPAGAWVDRLPARPLMVICDVVSALLYASLPAAAWAGVLTTGQVLVTSMRFLVFGTIPLGALLAGSLATALGTRAALWVILACFALSGAFLVTPAMLSQRNLPGRSPDRLGRTASREH